MLCTFIWNVVNFLFFMSIKILVNTGYVLQTPQNTENVENRILYQL